MIRHPLLLVGQALCGLAMAAVAQSASSRPAPQVEPASFALALLGENERADGSWKGVDLGASADPRAQRFQINLRPATFVRASLDVVGPDGKMERLFPTFGKTGLLDANKTYALPGPRAFYQLVGRSRLRLTITSARVHGEPKTSMATFRGVQRTRTLPLSDGSKVEVVERDFSAAESGSVDIDLNNE